MVLELMQLVELTGTKIVEEKNNLIINTMINNHAHSLEMVVAVVVDIEILVPIE